MTWREDYALIAMGIAVAIVVAMLALCGGCATGARKAVLTASDAVDIAVRETRSHCRWLAKEGCKTNPCPKLTTCLRAERFLGHGAAAMQEGLKEINEVIDE